MRTHDDTSRGNDPGRDEEAHLARIRAECAAIERDLKSLRKLAQAKAQAALAEIRAT